MGSVYIPCMDWVCGFRFRLVTVLQMRVLTDMVEIMKSASYLTKGRVLQNWVCGILRKSFRLSTADVCPAIMGESGMDVKLYGTARESGKDDWWAGVIRSYIMPGISYLVIRGEESISGREIGTFWAMFWQRGWMTGILSDPILPLTIINMNNIRIKWSLNP